MHAGNPRQLGLEMKHGPKIGIVRAQIRESAPEKSEELRLVMVGLGADFDQFDEIGRGLSSAKIFADATKWVLERNFRQRVQVRLLAAGDLDFRLEEQIKLSSKGTFRAPGAARDRLDAT